MTWHLRISPEDLLRLAVAALAAQRLRSVLSMIGLVCGTATVVAALTIGQGARRSAIEEIGALGVENIYVRSVGNAAPLLTRQDAAILAATLDRESAITAVRSARVQVASGPRRQDATLAGVGTEWPAVVPGTLVSGRWFTHVEERSRRRVAVLGGTLARQLFPDGVPDDARVLAGGVSYYVIGRLAETERSRGTSGTRLDVDRAVMVPVSTMDLSLGEGDSIERVEELIVRMADAGSVAPASVAIEALMARRHRDASRFELVVPQALLQARLRARRAFDAVLVGIGLLALLISGVGIMNIMLANVAERTQEVGVRRAFGARRGEIVAQFACEAAMLCVSGGLIGVPLGMAMAWGVAAAAGWPVSISAWSVLVALGLALSVGLLFGIYPARRAADVEPVVALRAL